MKKIICIFLFCSAAYTSQCQFIDTLQSAIEKKGKFIFSFNSRDSYIGTSYASIFGYMAGVCFGDKFTIGGGFNSLASPVYATHYINGNTVRAELSLDYLSYFVEYSINLTSHWELDIPVFIGVGSSSYQYTLDNTVINEHSKVILPLEPQVQVDYNFNKYWGLSTQVGYRLMLVNSSFFSNNINSITYSVGVSLSPLEIYAGLFPRTKLAKIIENDF